MESDIVELLLRGVAVGGFLGLALAVGSRGRTPARVTAVLFCVAAACHTLIDYAPVETILGRAWPLLWVPAMAGAGLFWAFATELFSDGQRLNWSRFAPAMVLVAVAIGARWSPEPRSRVLWIAHDAAGSGLMILVLVIIAAEWRGDLIEPRRRLRVPILAAGAVYVLVLTAVDTADVLGQPVVGFSRWDVVPLLVLSLASIAAFLRADPVLFGPAKGAVVELPRAVAAEDQALLGRLTAAMDRDEAWRREDLGIGDLAAIVGVPEHRLRKLINEGLGYRNFAAYLNERRIAASQQLLADPENARKPVSSIAYATGFGSLGPFNRAFKSATGETPTEWRRRVLAAAPNLEKPR